MPRKRAPVHHRTEFLVKTGAEFLQRCGQAQVADFQTVRACNVRHANRGQRLGKFAAEQIDFLAADRVCKLDVARHFPTFSLRGFMTRNPHHPIKRPGARRGKRTRLLGLVVS